MSRKKGIVASGVINQTAAPPTFTPLSVPSNVFLQYTIKPINYSMSPGFFGKLTFNLYDVSLLGYQSYMNVNQIYDSQGRSVSRSTPPADGDFSNGIYLPNHGIACNPWNYNSDLPRHTLTQEPLIGFTGDPDEQVSNGLSDYGSRPFQSYWNGYYYPQLTDAQLTSNYNTRGTTRSTTDWLTGYTYNLANTADPYQKFLQGFMIQKGPDRISSSNSAYAVDTALVTPEGSGNSKYLEGLTSTSSGPAWRFKLTGFRLFDETGTDYDVEEGGAGTSTTRDNNIRVEIRGYCMLVDGATKQPLDLYSYQNPWRVANPGGTATNERTFGHYPPQFDQICSKIEVTLDDTAQNTLTILTQSSTVNDAVTDTYGTRAFSNSNAPVRGGGFLDSNKRFIWGESQNVGSGISIASIMKNNAVNATVGNYFEINPAPSPGSMHTGGVYNFSGFRERIQGPIGEWSRTSDPSLWFAGNISYNTLLMSPGEVFEDLGYGWSNRFANYSQSTNTYDFGLSNTNYNEWWQCVWVTEASFDADNVAGGPDCPPPLYRSGYDQMKNFFNAGTGTYEEADLSTNTVADPPGMPIIRNTIIPGTLGNRNHMQAQAGYGIPSTATQGNGYGNIRKQSLSDADILTIRFYEP